MRKYILTRSYLFPSARVLARTLGIRATSYIKNYPPAIRWGNSDGVVDTEFNNPQLIGICASKRTFSEHFRGSDMPIVEYHRGDLPDRYPVCVRTIPNGMGGAGIVIAKNEQEFLATGRGFPWSYWYTFGYELGVHILGGKIAKIFKKVRENENDEFPIRNLRRGYQFKLRDAGHYPKLPAVVDKFFQALPLRMGRLDIGWDSINRVYRIIECNSAPGLAENDNTLELYANYLRENLDL